MARQARVEYENALHHIRCRGNNAQAIFLDDWDRIHFLNLLAEAVRHPDDDTMWLHEPHQPMQMSREQREEWRRA